MTFDRETKNMIAIMALFAALTLAINYIVVPDADQSFISWSVGLFVVAVMFWIWIRRDDLAAKRTDALNAAEDAARQAEDLAKKTKDQASAKIDIEDTKVVESIAEAVKEVKKDIKKEVVEPVVEAVKAVKKEVKKATEPDDLTKVEGIGPMYAQLLIDAGVTTYAQLASMSQDDIEKHIKDAGKRRPASVETWAEQAGFAAKGDWDGLEKLQATLDGGRRK